MSKNNLRGITLRIRPLSRTYSLTLYPLLHSFRRMAEQDRSMVILSTWANITRAVGIRNIAWSLNATMDFRLNGKPILNILEFTVTLLIKKKFII